jgi:hypothetical protein
MAIGALDRCKLSGCDSLGSQRTGGLPAEDVTLLPTGGPALVPAGALICWRRVMSRGSQGLPKSGAI